MADEIGSWANRFGLAVAPLFEREAVSAPGSHSVLLDGASGTFAMSVSEEELWRDATPANWAWSSDIPHHVTVTPGKVAVLRWDRPAEPRIFERRGIERNLERFYGFLTEDRPRSNRSVIEHLLGLFRRLRSLAHAAGVPDVRATDLFTASLARLMVGPDETPHPSDFGLADDANELLARLDVRGLAAVFQEIEHGSGLLPSLLLHPALAVRHAGGQLFQEAHFELLRGASDFDLFGLIGTSDVAPSSRGGAHFTPSTLARSIIERALETLDEPLEHRSELIVCDPACGSGAFLHEALRALRRAGYQGRLRLVGHDISSAAIAMARFAVRSSIRDWAPRGGVDLELHVGDTLGELGIPAADIIVMNPPFIGFATQSKTQRDQMAAVLGSAAGRGDYSMAFVQRALEALKPGGVLGTLFPASLLSLHAASRWREQILGQADLRFLASIGDFGLFSHAIVQVAAAIFCKGHGQSQDFVALITENDPQATSIALRQLRRSVGQSSIAPISGDAWSLFSVPLSALRERPTWRLPTPKAERILKALSQAGLPSVSDVFHIAQGIQTGLNSALLLTQEEFYGLPTKERRYFRKATMSDSIRNGQVLKPYWLFFPHEASGPLFADEAAVRKAAPHFFSHYLEVNRSQLENRASIVRSRRSDWWGLIHPRDWSFAGRPRIITKFFGAEGAFFGDFGAAYFAVMGHVWTLRRQERTLERFDHAETEGETDEFSEQEILAAFVALCNSEAFIKLLGLYAPSVAGGQYDLSSRHVGPVPVPDLWLLSLNPETGRTVRELSELGQRVDLSNIEWRQNTARAVQLLYGGVDLSAI